MSAVIVVADQSQPIGADGDGRILSDIAREIHGGWDTAVAEDVAAVEDLQVAIR